MVYLYPTVTYFRALIVRSNFAFVPVVFPSYWRQTDVLRSRWIATSITSIFETVLSQLITPIRATALTTSHSIVMHKLQGQCRQSGGRQLGHTQKVQHGCKWRSVTQYTHFAVAFFTLECRTVSQHTWPCNCINSRDKSAAFGTH